MTLDTRVATLWVLALGCHRAVPQETDLPEDSPPEETDDTEPPVETDDTELPIETDETDETDDTEPPPPITVTVSYPGELTSMTRVALMASHYWPEEGLNDTYFDAEFTNVAMTSNEMTIELHTPTGIELDQGSTDGAFLYVYVYEDDGNLAYQTWETVRGVGGHALYWNDDWEDGLDTDEDGWVHANYGTWFQDPEYTQLDEPIEVLDIGPLDTVPLGGVVNGALLYDRITTSSSEEEGTPYPSAPFDIAYEDPWDFTLTEPLSEDRPITGLSWLPEMYIAFEPIVAYEDTNGNGAWDGGSVDLASEFACYDSGIVELVWVSHDATWRAPLSVATYNLVYRQYASDFLLRIGWNVAYYQSGGIATGVYPDMTLDPEQGQDLEFGGDCN